MNGTFDQNAQILNVKIFVHFHGSATLPNVDMAAVEIGMCVCKRGVLNDQIGH